MEAPSNLPHHGQCIHYMAGLPCNDGSLRRCTGAHVEKCNRPPCPLYLSYDTCPRGAACWFPHVIEAPVSRLSPTLALQVMASHADRLQHYLADVFKLPASALQQCRAHGFSRVDPRVILLEVSTQQADDIQAFLASDPVVGKSLARMYRLQARTNSFEAAIAELLMRLDSLVSCSSCTHAVRLRVQAYPRAIENEVCKAVEAACSSSRPLCVTPSDFNAVACLVALPGVCYCGVAIATPGRGPGLAGFAQHMHTQLSSLTPAGECKRSRAFCKLQEVGRRTHAFNGVRGCSALDVGAAPGGWSSFLASDTVGAACVVAVDGAELDQSQPLPPAIQHWQMKIEDAIPLLLREGGPRFATYVCDMNKRADEIFISALPLLLRGAAVVLTLKNFDGTAAAFRSAVDRAKATMVALPSLDPSSVKVLHLMSNGADEVTLVARLKSDAD